MEAESTSETSVSTRLQGTTSQKTSHFGHKYSGTTHKGKAYDFFIGCKYLSWEDELFSDKHDHPKK
jgi:hypothetical protein